MHLGKRENQLSELEFRASSFFYPWEKASLSLFKPDWITSLSPCFNPSPLASLLLFTPLVGGKCWPGAALMVHADCFIPLPPPHCLASSALKCAQVSGSSSEVTLFIYAKLAHLWNRAFKASDIKDSKAGPIKSEQGRALHHNKLKQLCEP